MAGYPAHDHQLRGHDYGVLHRCEQCGSRLPVDAAVTIQHGACRMQGGGANPDWIRLTCIVLPREAGLTTARLAFSFTAESASLDENTPFPPSRVSVDSFLGSGCIVRQLVSNPGLRLQETLEGQPPRPALRPARESWPIPPAAKHSGPVTSSGWFLLWLIPCYGDLPMLLFFRPNQGYKKVFRLQM